VAGRHCLPSAERRRRGGGTRVLTAAPAAGRARVVTAEAACRGAGPGRQRPEPPGPLRAARAALPLPATDIGTGPADRVDRPRGFGSHRGSVRRRGTRKSSEEGSSNRTRCVVVRIRPTRCGGRTGDQKRRNWTQYARYGRNAPEWRTPLKAPGRRSQGVVHLSDPGRRQAAPHAGVARAAGRREGVSAISRRRGDARSTEPPRGSSAPCRA
jgi:hypothetical protein